MPPPWLLRTGPNLAPSNVDQTEDGDVLGSKCAPSCQVFCHTSLVILFARIYAGYWDPCLSRVAYMSHVV